MANETVTVTGASGTQYVFDVFSVGTQFNAVAGVYILMKDTGTKYSILYVGETDSLKRRLNEDPPQNHDGYVCASRKGMTHIAAKVETVGTKRLQIETDLVGNYNPPCNK